MTPDLRTALERHQESRNWPGRCYECGRNWPCDASCALAEMPQAREERPSKAPRKIRGGSSILQQVASATPYRTIVADPPWEYPDGWPGWGTRKALPYPSMTTDAIAVLPVRDWLASEGYLFLWTTNRYLEDAYRVVRAWGCRPSTVLVWCKKPMGLGPGGMFAITTEFVIVAQRINPGTHAHGRRTNGERMDSTWFEWPRGEHSRKPDAFLEMVERVSPGPYLEMFARRRRVGWDVWGDEAHEEQASQAEMGLVTA